MPIRAPGYRPIHGKLNRIGKTKRNIVAMLSLTAMVDMFTVLTVFLLQNYNPETGAVLDIPQEVSLPQARMSRELKPSHVVTISAETISLGELVVTNLADIADQESWLIRGLFDNLKPAIERARAQQEEDLGRQFQESLQEARALPATGQEDYKQVTVQADRTIDFSIIKRVMYTVTEAGGGEINFAVLRKEGSN